MIYKVYIDTMLCECEGGWLRARESWCVCVCVVVYRAGLTGLSPLSLMLVLPSGAARSVHSFWGENSFRYISCQLKALTFNDNKTAVHILVWSQQGFGKRTGSVGWVIKTVCSGGFISGCCSSPLLCCGSCDPLYIQLGSFKQCIIFYLHIVGCRI